MRHEKISPAGATNGAVVHCSEHASYTAKAGKSQDCPSVLRQYLTGFKAPIHLLAERGGNPPAVWIDRYPNRVIVGMDNRPWGWSNPTREFLDVSGTAAEAYARSLGQKLIDAANAKAADIARRREARWRERMGLPLDWGVANDCAR